MQRGLDVRDFTADHASAAPGSLLACRLMDILGLPRSARAAEPGQRLRRSGCSPSTSATTTCRPPSPGTPTSTSTRARGRSTTTCRRQAARGARPARASPRRAAARSAPPTCATSGQAFEVRVPVAGRRAGRRRGRRVARAPSTTRTAQLYGYDFAERPAPGGRVGEPPGHRRRPDPPARRASTPAPGDGGTAAPSQARRRGVLRRRGSTRRSTTAPSSARATCRRARR